MNKQTEALNLALEALKQIDEAMPFPVAKLAQKVIREALAEQPAQQQEPVLWQILNGVCHAGVRSTENLAKEAAAGMQKTHDLGGSLAAFHVRPLYTSPPANANAGKPWRELTKPEKKAVLQKTAESIESGNIIMTHWPLVANAIEAAVIEKNAPNGITGEQK